MAKFATFLGIVVFVLFIVFGWVALLWVVYNAVAPAVGLPALSYWVIFGINFLIGCIGSAFRSPAVKQ